MSAREITSSLGGRWRGEYGLARCPVHDDRTPSLKVWEWHGETYLHCFAGCPWRDVKAELRRRGLLPGFDPKADNVPTETGAQRRKRREQEDRERQQKVLWARSIWTEAKPAPGTLVERYLKQRGITITTPPTLRYHPALKHAATGLAFPAMVGAVTKWPGGDVIGSCSR